MFTALYIAYYNITYAYFALLGIAQLDVEETSHIPRTYSHTTQSSQSSQSSTPPHNRRGFSKNLPKDASAKGLHLLKSFNSKFLFF